MLVDIFLNIADAIREKLNYSNKIIPLNFIEEIDKIDTYNKPIRGTIDIKCRGIGEVEGLESGIDTGDPNSINTTKSFVAGGNTSKYGCVVYQPYSHTVTSTSKVYQYNVYSTIVYGWDEKLTKISSQSFTHSNGNPSTCSSEDYMLIIGGFDYIDAGASTGYNGYYNRTSKVSAINNDFTVTYPSEYIAVEGVATTTIGNSSVGYYMMITGGYRTSARIYGDYYNNIIPAANSTCVAYNSSLTKSTDITPITAARMGIGSTTVNDVALFFGGYYASNGRLINNKTWSYGPYIDSYSYIDAYDKSLTKLDNLVLSGARGQVLAGNIGEYAICAGGVAHTYTNNWQIDQTYFRNVDIIDKALTTSLASQLSQDNYAGTRIRFTSGSGAYADNNTIFYFANNFRHNIQDNNNVYFYSDYYDDNLTKTIYSNNNLGRYFLTNIDNYFIGSDNKIYKLES